MNLTPSQLGALKTWLDANAPSLTNEQAKDALNALPGTDWWVWRTLVTESEVYEQPSADATTWSWTIYINRTQAEREAWRQMVSMRGGLKPALANVRQGIADIFSGAGGLPQRTHLLAVGRRKATVAEQLFSTGTGSTASPAVMGAEGEITVGNVAEARSL